MIIKTEVWLSEYSNMTLDELANPHTVEHSVNYSNAEMSVHGWTHIGTAEVKITMFDRESILGNKVAALNEQAKTIKADAEVKVGKIREQISSLLAITNA